MPGNVDTITNNLNEIISTKNEFKQIIQENGLTAGTVFSQYPSQIRSIIGSGGGGGYIDYLNTYQFAYVSGISGTAPGCAVNLAGDGSLIFQGSYVKANVFSYPLTADFTGYEFVSMGTLKNYVNSYASTYITSTTIDENIIPKENNTYTLGDSTYLYAASYVSDMWLNANNRFSNRSNNQINLQLNGSWRYTFHTNNFGPAADNTRDLGESSVRWKSTYSYSLYATVGYLGASPIATEDYVATYVATYGGGGSATINENIIPKENNAYTLGDASNMYKTTYTYITYLGSSKIYHNADNSIYIDYKNGKRLLLGPSTIYGSAGLSIGTSSFPFTNTYTTYLYLNGTNIKDSINGMFSYDSTTGILTITSLT